jgi:GNAT superfamily N-acetyltransferase
MDARDGAIEVPIFPVLRLDSAARVSLEARIAGDAVGGSMAVRVPSSADDRAAVFGAWDDSDGRWVGWAALLSGPSALAEVLFRGVATRSRELAQVWVDPERRRRGLGTALVRAALSEVDEADGRTSLLCAKGWREDWYRRHGFFRSADGRSGRYAGHDYVHMTRLRSSERRER